MWPKFRLPSRLVKPDVVSALSWFNQVVAAGFFVKPAADFDVSARALT